MMLALKFLPLVLELIKIGKEVWALGQRLYVLNEKRVKAIEAGQQTSVEDRQLQEVNVALSTQNENIAELVKQYALSGKAKDNASKAELKETGKYLSMVAGGVVGLVCITAALQRPNKA